MIKDEVLAALKESGDYVSGQELCGQLSVSRTAVWKAVSKLKEEGSEIDSVPNRGYCLLTAPDAMTEAEIRTSVLKDLGIAFVFSILEAVFFIRDAVRKSKAAAAAETEAAAKNPAEF